MIRKILQLATKEKTQFCDITREVQDFVNENKIKEGVVTVRTLHTTTSIFINENEEGLLKDIEVSLDRIFPGAEHYNHDDFSRRNMEECRGCGCKENGPAHLKAMLLGHDVTVSVVNGKLALGKWQAIFFLELDGPKDSREVEMLACF